MNGAKSDVGEGDTKERHMPLLSERLGDRFRGKRFHA